jgi:hypothetical protein
MVMFKSGEHTDIMRKDRKDDGEVEELMRGAYDIETTWVPLLWNTTCTTVWSVARSTMPTNERWRCGCAKASIESVFIGMYANSEVEI